MFKIYKTYYQFIFRYKGRFLLFLTLLISWSVVESIYPYFYKLFVDTIPGGDYRKSVYILVLYIGTRLTGEFLSISSFIAGDRVLLPSARDARLAVFKKIQDLDFAYHLTKSTGSLISALKRGDSAYFSIFHVVHMGIFRVAIGFLVLLYFFFRVSPVIALLMTGVFAVNFFFSFQLLRYNRKAKEEWNAREDEVSALIVDNMINFETVKLFARENWELSRLRKTFGPWLASMWKFANSFRMIDVTAGTLGNLGLFAVLFYSLNLVRQDLITAGDFVMVVSFCGSFYYRFFELIFKIKDLVKNNIDLEKYFVAFDYETVVKDPEEPIIPALVSGQIDFVDLGFSYPDGKQGALSDVNLTIEPGESIAFVGHSGAGKTTIIKLLMRFFDPTEGKILLDGVDIREMTKDTLRSFMGVVPQDPILFNDSIEFNIAYGASKYSQKDLMNAVKIANLDEFIDSMPKGLKTKVGERGVKLSGGQKQRLAIARMILADPTIIIFDEATSQLDSQSEKKIQDAFWKASKDKTTLIIAHRLSTVIKADKIIVMDEGKIVEVGTHRQLLRSERGLYRKFWELQTMEEREK